ncbi:hypothetical protein [Cellulomonas soli]
MSLDTPRKAAPDAPTSEASTAEVSTAHAQPAAAPAGDGTRRAARSVARTGAPRAAGARRTASGRRLVGVVRWTFLGVVAVYFLVPQTGDGPVRVPERAGRAARA